MWEEFEHLMDDLLVPEGLIEFVIFNLQDIMSLADRQCHPDYFLWNIARMNEIDKALSISDDGNMNLSNNNK
jgi:hypothetical protein